MRRRLLVGAAALIGAVILAVTTAFAPDCRAPSETHAISFAFAGDSTTAQPDSWIHQLTDPRITAVGGFARDGFTSQQVLSNITPVKADVLVVMLGINDLHFVQTENIENIVANVNRIVARVGVSRVIVSAVAPSDVTYWAPNAADSRSAQGRLNIALKRDSLAHEWTFVDPYSKIRTSDGGYRAGFTIDNIHPTVAGYAIVASAMTRSIRAQAVPAECGA
jgi:lysophospholipase L1-like esterase